MSEHLEPIKVRIGWAVLNLCCLAGLCLGILGFILSMGELL